MTTPESIFQSSDCLVQSLSVSNDHATILLRTTEYDKVIRSLLKLTVLPGHTDILTPSKDIRGLEPDDLGSAFSPEESVRIKDFLSEFCFELNSESGAEYSYYDAKPKQGLGGGTSFSDKPRFRVELISPASENQIRRSLPVPSFVLVEETPEIYQQIVAPYILGVVESGSLGWIKNVVSGKKESERLLYDTEDYILNVDTKWKTHPDPKTVPQEEWKTHTKAIDDLYCLAIVKETGLASIRDLRARHIPMLRNMLRECPLAIQQTYGVPSNQLRIFFHYQPQFYHLHVHVTRLENEIGSQVERGHLVNDVIQNLEMDNDYYTKRTITYKLRTNETIYKLIQQTESLRQVTDSQSSAGDVAEETVEWTKRKRVP